MTDDYVELPALSGRDHLGFLAALGVLWLLDSQGVPAHLSFDPMLAGARLGGVASIDEVVDHLLAALASRPDDGLMVGMPARLAPAPESGEGFSDPARISPEQFTEHIGAASDALARSWVRALWTDLAVSDGKCAVSPFYAPTGKMTLRTTFDKPTRAMEADAERFFREALVSWRRVDGFTGENLDIRAVRGAAEQQNGRATMSGVPGATWLALSAIPLFPMGGDGSVSRTLRWRWLQVASLGRRRLCFTWPIWTTALDIDAVRALLSHTAVDLAADFAAGKTDAHGRFDGQFVRDQLTALGVPRVSFAHRRQLPGGKSAGVLVTGGSWG